jgi:hypothetical protein
MEDLVPVSCRHFLFLNGSLPSLVIHASTETYLSGSAPACLYPFSARIILVSTLIVCTFVLVFPYAWSAFNVPFSYSSRHDQQLLLTHKTKDSSFILDTSRQSLSASIPNSRLLRTCPYSSQYFISIPTPRQVVETRLLLNSSLLS